MRNNNITLYYIVASRLCEIKIPAASLFELQLYVTVMYTKRVNIVFITQYVLRNWNVNIRIYEHYSAIVNTLSSHAPIKIVFTAVLSNLYYGR
jgi:hypothetical protein